MSYSFSARGATKAEVMQKVAAELDKVVASQTIHAADRAHAQAAAETFLGVVTDPSGSKDFYVSVSGSVSWGLDDVITAASVNVSAGLMAKEKT